ncbi:MAG: S-layer homology domain-containing protein, partial [Clostridia bacterium]|nr:S-layer homology domain-containing protein [Clostridia bacterium]
TTTPSASLEATPDELVIPYTKMQKGNVDHKQRANIDASYSDKEKGTVVKVAPIPDTTESGAVAVDGYGAEPLKIDVTKYNYVTMEYKLVTKADTEYKPYIRFLPGAGPVLTKTADVPANEKTLVKNEWSTMTFNMGSAVKPLVAPGKQFLTQLHFYPFGNITPSNFSEGDHILIGNVTFSVANPNGDVYYTATFEKGEDTAEGTDPAPMKGRFDDEIILPQIPYTNGDAVAQGWLPNAGVKVYKPGESFRMPESDTKFIVIWKSPAKLADLVELNFSQYQSGICDHKDTATLETVTFEGNNAVEVTPNLQSSFASTAINVDGWNYTGANINIEAYGTIMVLYKYVSDTPVTGKTDLNIMKSSVFSKFAYMKAREDIVANKWALASFDLTAVRNIVADGIEPVIKQMHYYPLGNNKVETLNADDRVYVAKMYVIPDASQSAAIHESFMSGYADGTFGIAGNMTRAEACTIVARLVAGNDAAVPSGNTTAFTDVPADQWYHKYVAYVESLGFLKSYSGEFKPNQAITRAEFVELVYNMGLLQDAGKNGTFTDVPADHVRAEVIAAAGKAGLVNGYDNGDGTFSFKPDATITRAEVVKVINNAYGRKPTAEGIFETAKGKFSDVTPDHWAYADILDAATAHMSIVDENGNEKWFALYGNGAITEDFQPDFEAGLAKVDEVQALFDKRVAEIKATPSTKYDIKGKTYYVSTSGNDANDGLSPNAPFATAAKATATAKSGDLVLFKRGDMWRERWSTKDGVIYSAYGEGEKPTFNGNLHGDVAVESLWSLVSGTSNIWKYNKKINDVGNIVLNGGEATVEKIVPWLSGGKVITGKAGREFDLTTDLVKDLSFVNIYDTINNDTITVSGDKGLSTLYVRCDAGNPGKIYDSIELAYYGNLIAATNNTTLDNLKIVYTGSHGVGMGTVKNVKFTNLEVGYIGGTCQYYKNGQMTRFGNGIEVYGGCNNYIIDNCYVYQCYDAGITHQISKGGLNEVIEQNVKFTNNVIDKCIYNIEYFMGQGDADYVTRIMKNIEYSDNLLARSGYGWGMNPGRAASVKGWDHYNRSENFVIKNNIFFLDRVYACDLGASMRVWLPKYEGNTYIQKYGNGLTRVSASVLCNGQAAQVLESNHGEKDFEIFYVPADYEVK